MSPRAPDLSRQRQECHTPSANIPALNCKFSPEEHLPRWEIALSFFVWVSHIVYSCFRVYEASRRFEAELYVEWMAPGRLSTVWNAVCAIWLRFGHSVKLSSRLLCPATPALIHGRSIGSRRDIADVEWAFFVDRLFYPKLICLMTYYVMATLIVGWMLQKYDTKVRKLASLIIDTCLLCIMHGPRAVFTVSFHGFCMFFFGVRLFRRPEAIWVLAFALLTSLHFEWYGHLEGGEFFDFGGMVGYKLLQYISFCSSYLNKRQKMGVEPCVEDALLDMFAYCAYLPYSTILIVTYDEYERQMNDESREINMIDFARIFKLAFRLVFWIFFADLVLHFFYIHALMLDPSILIRVDLPTLCSIGYLAGQFFYLKYVCIFGVPSLFAIMDGMHPPWPPICISRVNFYSKIWRYFDRGLYGFLLNEIFVPLSKPYFSLGRKISAAALCFGFIWFWHGARSYLFTWAVLNFVGLTLEHGANSWARRNVDWIMLNFSPRCQQRLLSCWGVVCVPWGLFGIFYFLGGSDVGYVFFKRLFVENVPFGMSFFYLLCLGYFFGICCCFIDRYYRRRKLY